MLAPGRVWGDTMIPWGWGAVGESRTGWTYVCMYVDVYVYTQTCTCTHIHAYTCIPCIHIRTDTYTHVRVDVLANCFSRDLTGFAEDAQAEVIARPARHWMRGRPAKRAFRHSSRA